jgi:hypothetical protein
MELFRLCRHPSIRTLLSDGSLGASWASSIHQVLPPVNRPEKRGGLNGSLQHLLKVLLKGPTRLISFATVDSSKTKALFRL